VEKKNEAFKLQLQGATDAYLSWYSSLGNTGYSNENPTPSSRVIQDEYRIEVVDVFRELFLP